MKNLIRLMFVWILTMTFAQAGYEEFKKAENIYEFSSSELLSVLNSSSEDKYGIKSSLENMDIIQKNEDGMYEYKKIVDVKRGGRKFSSIAYDSDGNVVMTGDHLDDKSKCAFIYYYTKEYSLKKIVVIVKTSSRAEVVLSNDAKYAYVKFDKNIYDIKTFKKIKLQMGKEFSFMENSIEFSSDGRHMIIKAQDTTFDGDISQTSTYYKIDLKNGEIVGFSFAENAYNYFYNNQHTNYIDINNKSISLKNRQNEVQYTFKKDYKAVVNPFVAWRGDLVFINYAYTDKKDKTHWDKGGIYNTKTSTFLCENSFKVSGNVRDIGWISKNKLYVLDEKRINYFALSNDECLSIGSNGHNIKELKNINKTHIQNNILTVYPYRFKGSVDIEHISLRDITEDTVMIYKTFVKINKLLKADFEKRALKTIDKLVDTQYKNLKGYHRGNIEVEKNSPAYKSYFLAMYIKKHKAFDYDLYDSFRVYLVYAYWNGYYKQAKEMTEYMKSLQIPEKKFKDLINLSDAMYLLCIGKDEGYDMLFDMQPISKKLKSDIEVFTRFQTPFSKNIDKLIASLDMKKSEFGKNSVLNDRNNIFFDIDGNKITNGKKIEKKAVPKASKKSDAIKLLD